MAGTAITIWGLWTAIGKTVSVFLAGLDCGDFVVQTDGSVVVPYQSDQDKLLTASYLQSISSTTAYGNKTVILDVTIGGVLTRVYVPCVIGFTYTSTGETLRPMAQSELKTAQGPAFGLIREVNQTGLLFQNTIGGANGLNIRSGPNSTWFPTRFRTAGDVTALNYTNMFSGMYWDVADGPAGDLDGVLSWRMTRPFPATVSAISFQVTTGER